VNQHHPSREELIDFSFELLDGDRAAAIHGHLASCAECRQTLEQAMRKLEQLDILGETPEVPASLLASVEALAAETATHPPGAAAQPGRKQFRLLPALLAVAAVLVALGLASAIVRMLSATPEVPVAGAGADQAEEKPPFAPGSNIELNVLPRRDDLELTIYNEADLTLVRERRTITVGKGWNWLQFMWANTLIDPTSVDLEPRTPSLGLEVNEMTYPPRTKGIGRWLLHAKAPGPAEIEITYLTSGIAWRAFYMGTLTPDETRMRLQGYVRIDNRSGEDYREARARVVVGRVNLTEPIASLARRQYPHGSPLPPNFDDGDRFFAEGGASRRLSESRAVPAPADLRVSGGREREKQVLKRRLSEYVLYTIEGRETIPDGWGKRLPSLPPVEVPVENLYKYDEERWGPRVIRFLSFANDRDHELGDTPLPNGSIRVFAGAPKTPPVDDPAGRYLTYVGQAPVKYIPVGEEAELELGEARELLVEPVMLSQQAENFEFDRNGNVAGWDDLQEWRIDIRNARHVHARLQITRAFPTTYWDVAMREQPQAFAKHDAAHARFTLRVPPRERRTIRFFLRLHRGTREDDWRPPAASTDERKQP
jgi:hypothetical protein